MLIPTLRQPPAEATVPSHILMLRAGLIQQVAGGAYSYLPLGWRVLHKVTRIVREEMDRAGALEVLLPTIQPVEWWEQTGRRADYGENLFVVRDRHGRDLALGPTHEEVITQLIKTTISSYRQLPLNLYQIQTKFRDEFRPRFGVLRSREFQMKDAYSFDLDKEGLDKSYQAMYEAYRRIFDRCGIPYVIVDAETGEMGGSASQQFTVPSPTGEDVIFTSDKGNYAANLERCATGERPHSFEGEPTGELDTIHTPQCPGIDDVIAFFKSQLGSKLKPQNMLKTLVCRGRKGWVVTVVRGDHELNEEKLRGASDSPVALADDVEARDAGFAIGFVGPQIVTRRDDVTLIVDPDAAQTGFWVTGANEPDHHVRHFAWQRDVLDPLGERATKCVRIADIRNAQEGDPSPKNDGGVLQAYRGIEVGQIFKLGTKYSESLGATVLDAEQQERPIIMGCYGIGVNRIIAAAIESQGGGFHGHDQSGIHWPVAIAPYSVLLTPVRYEGRAREVADKLHDELHNAGVDVLLDDRDERPGVKFKDADLIGIPLRITIGEKGLKNEQVEFKPRAAQQPEMVSLDAVADRALQFVRDS